MSDYLNKVFTTATNRKIWTTSFWIKRTNLGNTSHVIGAGSTSARPTMEIFISNTGVFGLSQYNGSGYDITLNTNRLLRDCHAWYHIIVAVDTTQATASNRVKIYFNGIEETSFSTANYFSQNFEPAVNSATTHSIGRNPFGNGAGSMTDSVASFYFIDGQALTPSSFGETDATTGIWKPKAYTGSYGTNGFFLKFENSGSLGTDSSGNGNNFTVNGTPTQTLDTPSNNFATLNPLGNSSGTYSNGNLTRAGGNDTISTFGVTAGKWYWEYKLDTQGSGGSASHWGIVTSNSQKNADDYVSSVAGFGAIFIRHDYAGTINSYASGGFSSISNTNISSVTFTNNDIISCAVDLNSATKELKMYKNNVHILTSTFSYDGTTPVYAYVRYNSGSAGSVNFGNGRFGTTAISSPYSDGAGFGKFQYQPPTGYYSLCTKNINVYG